MNNQVVHRNGKSTPLDILKIREVVSWACHGISGVNGVELEAFFSARLKDTITTREIHGNLITNCLELCVPEFPNWRYVAGRLHMWSLWKEVKVQRNLSDIKDIYASSFQAIKEKINANIYRAEILKKYNLDELEEACNWLNAEADKNYDYAGSSLLISRYLLPNELVQESYLVTALLLAVGYKTEIKNKLALAKQIYQTISERKISLASPILSNLRQPDTSCTSCFILNMEDDLTSIFKVISQCAEISKQGGGLGVCVSKVRATGSWVRNRPNASGGVVPWIKILNDTALAVNQGGRRAGAITVALDIWHLDVLDFLELKTEHGDHRRKAYDVFPQLVIPDEFMRRVERDEEWTLLDPYEVKKVFKYDLATLHTEDFEKAYEVIESEILCLKNLFSCEEGCGKATSEITLYKRVKAKDLFKQIMRTQLDTGLPYLAFKDAINKANPNKKNGYIPSVNLCTESFSNVSATEAHACDLVSLNLARITPDELPVMTELAVTILDNSLDLAQPPIKEAQYHHSKYRVIGVGVLGLADWLAKQKYTYTANQKEINLLFEDIAYYAYKASIDLAKVRGTFTAYKASEWAKGFINCQPKAWYKANSKQYVRWERLFDELQEYGIRNSQVLAIAPNTSSSLIQGSTASILPAYNRFFFDKAKGSYPIAPPYIDDYFWFYEENIRLNQQIVVDTVSNIQKWIDTGISMELSFNLSNVVPKDIYDILISAWKQKIKAIYYIRTVTKNQANDVNCSTCEN
jgi:ribonucleoside-diphosphate reductase alpha chain